MSFNNFQDKATIEVLDTNLQDFHTCFSILQSQIRPSSSENEVFKVINSYIQANEISKLSKALVYGSLSNLEWSKYLFTGNQDLLQYACSALTALLPSLKSRQPGLQLFIKLWKSNCPNFSDLFLPFFRTFDFPVELKQELDWLCNGQFTSLIFYKLLRSASMALSDGSPLISDYSYLIQSIWRLKKDSCILIGRDLMRILPSFAEVSGMDGIWNDLYTQQRDGCYLYWSLLYTPTQLKYHSVLLTPNTESKLVYVLENSIEGNYSRYLRWLIDESGEFIIPDLIRFVVNFYGSKESTPRWQIIAWLLGCSVDHGVQASAKQALIFDALFFNSADQINSIEPLMSLLKHSLGKNTNITEEILEFLLTSAELYDKRSVAGIMKSLRECFSVAYFNRIVPSIDCFLSDERIDVGIKAKLSELADSSCNSESSHDEETPPSTPRSFEMFGEVDLTEMSFDKLEQILKKNTLSKDLAFYVLKSLAQELALPILIEIPKNSIIFQVLSKAEFDEKIAEFLRLASGLEGLLGVRVLIYSLQNKSNLYFRLDLNIEKDLRCCNDEVSLETLNWVYPFLLNKQKMTPAVFFYFLSTVSHELLFTTELNLYSGKFKLISPYFNEILSLACNISVMEKRTLWKLINAELPSSYLPGLIDHCAVDYSPENWSGLLDYFRMRRKGIGSMHVQSLLCLPLHLCSVVAALIGTLEFSVVTEGIVLLLRSLNLTCLAHFKYWVKNRLRVCGIISSEVVQDMLQRMVKGLPIEDFEEFSCLVEGPKRLECFKY